MTWSINVNGHDDLEAEAKEAFENGLVAKVVELVQEIRSGAGVTVSLANVTTNTTGPVDALGATEGNEGGGGEADPEPVDPDAEPDPDPDGDA